MKLLNTIAQEKNLSYDKKRILAYGKYRDYSVSIRYESNLRRYSVTAYADLAEGAVAQPFPAFGQGLKAECKRVTNTETTDKRLTVYLTGKGSGKKDMENLDLVLNRLTDYLRLNAFKDSCSVCGTTDYLHWYDLNNQVNHMCDNCFNRIVESLESTKQQIKSKRGNLFTGIIGALLGALLGGALMVAVAQMGYVATIVGIVMGLCIVKGYELFGGKVNALGVVICIVILIATVYGATVMDYAIYLQGELFSDKNIFLVFRYTPEIVFDPKPVNDEFRNSFIRNLAMGYIFSLVGAVPTLIAQLRNKSGVYKAGRIDEVTA